MTLEQLQKQIAEAKKENDVCILAHSYQNRAICEAADIVGDSFKLSVEAQKVKNKKIVMCGVHFMAETAKLLSPEKTVILAAEEAGCPMAEQFYPEEVIRFREAHPDYQVVSYINTTAALKCVTDVCVTSSSAVEIVGKLGDKILFIPDKNLGAFVQKAYPE
ncbi:MAG: quinolinate synthase NadA, partial [Oscillospiraceae bacterium]|nr:quinolinate synthase NadA [Oscillospiraceae bacterium]